VAFGLEKLKSMLGSTPVDVETKEDGLVWRFSLGAALSAANEVQLPGEGMP
jgi:hypothetical protein